MDGTDKARDGLRAVVAVALLNKALEGTGRDVALLRDLARGLLFGERVSFSGYPREALARASMQLLDAAGRHKGAARGVLKGLAGMVGEAGAARTDSWERFLAEHPELFRTGGEINAI